MRIIESGKYKGKTLSECPTSYLKWLVSHEKVLALRNRWLSRDAKFLLERMAQAVAQVEALKEYEARKEAEMAVKVAEQLINDHKADVGMRGHLSSSQGFRLMR